MKRNLLPAALVLALSGAFAVSTFAVAQTPQQAPAPIERHHHQAKDPHKAALKLSRKLNLSAEQTAKLEPILADRQQKMQALFANNNLAPQDRKKQMHAIRKDTMLQLSGVLTPDQLQQMKSMRHGGHHKSQPDQPAA